jgi:hypothetical protein
MREVAFDFLTALPLQSLAVFSRMRRLFPYTASLLRLFALPVAYAPLRFRDYVLTSRFNGLDAFRKCS